MYVCMHVERYFGEAARQNSDHLETGDLLKFDLYARKKKESGPKYLFYHS